MIFPIGLFTLDSISGILYPAKPLKASSQKQAYKLNVEARDVNGTGKSSDEWILNYLLYNYSRD